MRPWGPVFWLKNDPDAHHVFRSFVSEYFGDSRASPQLFAVYKDCMCMIYCEHVTKLYMDGWREINQSKVHEVRQVARDHVIWKRDVTKYIMKQVKEMKTKSSTTVVCCENAMAEVSSWSSYMHALRPTYYWVN